MILVEVLLLLPYMVMGNVGAMIVTCLVFSFELDVLATSSAFKTHSSMRYIPMRYYQIKLC